MLSEWCFGMETLHFGVDFVSQCVGSCRKVVWPSRSAPNKDVRTLGVKESGDVDMEEKGRLQARHVEGQGEGFSKGGQVGPTAQDLNPSEIDPSCGFGAPRENGVDISSKTSRRSDKSQRMKRVIMAEVDDMPERRYSIGRAIVSI
ncbi:hypothetical protein F5144DRAFT_595461 [Chaetomium tenue]|uniref:Uncharacterized protein n=1 Tax=Chaetomium tenue TaxID=1854479 RepID=A0ACB7P3N7_9PEZI|nr:hypothetical protein F5144DRAFT_595461 [Chaetomium globosum]